MADSGRGYTLSVDQARQYNTPLSTDELKQFNDWTTKNSAIRGYDLNIMHSDYDLQGWWKNAGGVDAPDLKADGAHFTDQFKKPNHPTFSDESQYNGVNGNQGGHWGQDPVGGDTFTPGPTNLQNYSLQNLSDYFDAVEPNSTFILQDK